MTTPSTPDRATVSGRGVAPGRAVPPAPTVFGPTDVDPAGLRPHGPESAAPGPSDAGPPGPGAPALEVVVDGVGAEVRVAVRGELLQETAESFVAAVERVAHDPTVARVVVDLSGTAFMDSTGLGSLVTLRNHVVVRGGTVTVVRPEDRVFRLFEITRLDTVFDFADDA